ncbi:Rrf2 family transcriptional regulator [Pacificimonas sp. WHA3]|uniref:Rrf2 family transcriptional regulator n=1 Tax=Pacificimonas pallii TaxID=2827236 RepID=A0ABS6SHQ7_9SPHN|nr:Rrf2 family transcriptional regulator [Pacificimonas pallii]MBV7257920.1 Rrf2 family transcriptional regulator [Pacificimonas pallii]
MRLTRHTDYAIRVLMHLGAADRLVSISEIASAYGISQNHLMKVVHNLGKAGYVASVRGRAGGVRLALPASAINLGDLIRDTEESLDLVDCAHCVVAPACGFTAIVDEALSAFLAVFDRYTLADVLTQPSALLALLRPMGFAATTLAEPQGETGATG